MNFILYFALPVVSVILFTYSLISNIRHLTIKISLMLVVEIFGLCLLIWSVNQIYKVAAAVGFAGLLIALIIVLIAIKYLIIKPKI